MPRIIDKTLGALALGALLPIAAIAQPGSGLANSAHNFAGNQGSGLCTFCHTPHKAQAQALLWNHTLSTNTFTWGDPATTAGTTYPSFDGDTYKGGTAKCLSCHDGSVAVGDIGWWNGGDPGSLDNTRVSGAFQVATATGDMTGNHPVAMPYPYQRQRNTYNGVQTGTAIQLAEWQADPQTLNIPLYSDDGAGNISNGATAGRTGMECGSCHDVHNGPNVRDVWLLYGTLGGTNTDYICMKCHIK
jgi:hypothetical protein